MKCSGRSTTATSSRPAAPAPTARHGITNRIEGKGFYWKQDNGIETIEYYPSVMFSNFVELTRFGGELSFCGPSDYIKIDDDLYIYSRVEAEFSGTMTTYVLDVNRAEQVGVRLGFDDTDTLEYYVFKGRGEWVGQIAQFEPFGDVGTTIALGNRNVPTAKGRPSRLPPDEDQPDHDPGAGGRGGRAEQDRVRAERDGRQQGADQQLSDRQVAHASLRQRDRHRLSVRRDPEAALAARTAPATRRVA